MNRDLQRLALAATFITFLVIILGAYVRLSHAGLSCPDWPGCYGHVTWPEASHEVTRANEMFPERPFETHKAWKEMVHRYLAGLLVVLVIAVNVLAWKSAHNRAGHRVLAGAVLAVILFQAALGMWTVTLKLLPIVVMGHLLGGLTTLALLVWLSLRSGLPNWFQPNLSMQRMRPWVILGLVVLTCQITLGGWTSANYAALACPDFPTCQGAFWPQADFAEGFTPWREIGVDYEGGILDLTSRVAIHLAHRIGAGVTLITLVVVSMRLLRTTAMPRSGAVLLILVVGQFFLGVFNVVHALPLPNAVAHNGLAALLLAQLIWLLHCATPRRA
jgi:cytochrome c oxidase assembly protein subunit 15